MPNFWWLYSYWQNTSVFNELMSLLSLCHIIGNLLTYIALAETPGAPGGCESGGGLGGGLGDDSECDGSAGIISILIFSLNIENKNKLYFVTKIVPTYCEKKLF